MSEMPPPTPPARNVAAAVPPVGSHAAVALVIGLVFLYLAMPFVQWLGVRDGNPYGIVWTEGGPKTGEVAYAELPAGTMWRDIGCFGTAVVLLAEAALYGLVMLRPAAARAVLTAILAVAAAGVAVNVLAAVMQYRAGFHDLPLYAVVGVVICVLSVLSARQTRRGIRPLVHV